MADLSPEEMGLTARDIGLEATPITDAKLAAKVGKGIRLSLDPAGKITEVQKVMPEISQANQPVPGREVINENGVNYYLTKKGEKMPLVVAGGAPVRQYFDDIPPGTIDTKIADINTQAYDVEDGPGDGFMDAARLGELVSVIDRTTRGDPNERSILRDHAKSRTALDTLSRLWKKAREGGDEEVAKFYALRAALWDKEGNFRENKDILNLTDGSVIPGTVNRDPRTRIPGLAQALYEISTTPTRRTLFGVRGGYFADVTGARKAGILTTLQGLPEVGNRQQAIIALELAERILKVTQEAENQGAFPMPRVSDDKRKQEDKKLLFGSMSAFVNLIIGLQSGKK